MLLVTLNINNDDHYINISDEYLALTDFWDAKIVSFGSIRYSTARVYGGYVQPVFGSISLLPDVFQGDDWPPPKTCGIEVKLANLVQEDAVTLFTGVIHRQAIKRDEIEYGLFGLDESENDASIAYTGNLEAEIAFECDPLRLNLTLNTDRTTRAASLDTGYSPSGKRDRLEVMSEVTAFFCHYFWIEGSTLYLADMFLDNEDDTLVLTEFEVLPSTYKDNPAYSLFKSDDYSVDGGYSYGKEYSISPNCQANEPNAVLALEDIREIIQGVTGSLEDHANIVIKAPLEQANIPNIGQKITLTDESLQEPVNITMHARAIIYDFDNYEMVIEGEGTLV